MINGLINGGSGTDQVILEGTGSEDDSFLNFETLTMRGERWTLSGNSMIPTTQVDSGTLLVNGLLASAVTVNPAGTLGGTGTVAGSVTNTGTVAPGDPGGTLTVDGAYTQTPAGTLEIGIDGTGTADRLAVTGTPGTAALAGTLQVVPLDQVIGDSVTDIVSASGGITGDFDTVVLGPTGRTTLDVGTTGDRVRLVSLSPAGFDSRVAAGTRTGTDADAFFTARGATPSLNVGVPNRYMHTPVEVVDLADLDAVADLLAATATAAPFTLDAGL